MRFLGGSVAACYDGRASAAENYEERTGVATGSQPGMLRASGSAPSGQAPGGGALRYLDVVPLADGRHRLYYEMRNPAGAHELRTELR